MKFGFGTKQERQIKLTESPEEKLDLAPATSKDGDIASVQVKENDSSHLPHRSTPMKAFAFLGALFAGIVLVAGQIFMVAGTATAVGTIPSALLGLSFDRIMFHCGPQDSILPIFVMAAVPIYWYAWYVRGKVSQYFLVALAGIGALLWSMLSGGGTYEFVVTLASALLLSWFHASGNYFASFQKNWPAKFSVTKWLVVCYVPAILLLCYEFSILNPDTAITQVSSETVIVAAAIIAAFSFLPALLTALDCRSKQFASGFGLSAIGQSPVIFSVLLYCIMNAVMLLCVSLYGPAAVADFFARHCPPGMEPDFDAASTQFDVMCKFLSSLVVFLSLIGSVWGGSLLGVFWNRKRYKDKPSN